MSNLVAEHLGDDLSLLPDYEVNFGEGDRGEIRLYLAEPLTQEQVDSIETELCSQGVVLTGPVVQDARVLSIKFEKRIAPLLIIGGVVAAVVAGLLGWQIFKTTQMGVPWWLWAVGIGSILYLLFRTKPVKAATGLAIQAGKIYIGKKILK